MKGNGANLCKVESKRRRTKAEVAANKLQKANADQEMQAKEQEIDELKATMDAFSDQNPDIVNRMGFVNDLVNNGLATANEDGSYTLNQAN